MGTHKKKLGIVIPLANEEKTVSTLIEHVVGNIEPDDVPRPHSRPEVTLNEILQRLSSCQ